MYLAHGFSITKYAETGFELEGYGGEPIMATQGVLVGVQLLLIGCPLPGQTRVKRSLAEIQSVVGPAVKTTSIHSQALT